MYTVRQLAILTQTCYYYRRGLPTDKHCGCHGRKPSKKRLMILLLNINIRYRSVTSSLNNCFLFSADPVIPVVVGGICGAVLLIVLVAILIVIFVKYRGEREGM